MVKQRAFRAQVQGGTVADHTLVCKELDRAVNAADSLNERLQRLADFCEAASTGEHSAVPRALLLQLADLCGSAALIPADTALTSSRSCQVRKMNCKSPKIDTLDTGSGWQVIPLWP